MPRVVLTASMATIAYSDRPSGFTYGPDDGSDVDWSGSSAYISSKTLAEQAAWNFVADYPAMQLTTVHPGLVLGTPMDRHFGTSLQAVQRILSGKDPAQPDLWMGIVDVEDVSRLHLAAMEDDAATGQRLIAAGEVISFVAAAEILAGAYPDRRIATRKAPWLLLKAIALFDPAVRGILPQVGKSYAVDGSTSLSYLPDGFTGARDALLRSADYVAALTDG